MMMSPQAVLTPMGYRKKPPSIVAPSPVFRTSNIARVPVSFPKAIRGVLKLLLGINWKDRDSLLPIFVTVVLLT